MEELDATLKMELLRRASGRCTRTDGSSRTSRSCIVRHKKKRGDGGASCSSGVSSDQDMVASMGEEMEEEEEEMEEEEGREALALLDEVRRLRQEQTAIGEQLVRMNRRLQSTEERQPDQLMSFLASLAEDPSATATAAQKKRQRMDSPIALPLQPLPVADAAVDGVCPSAPKPKPLSLTTFEQPTLQQVPFPFCLLGV